MSAKPNILALNANPRNLELLTRFLSGAGYAVLGASAVAEFYRLLQNEPKPALALLDLTGFEANLEALCRALSDGGIPFALIAQRYTPALQQKSLAYGARAVLIKPLTVQELLRFIKNALN